MSADIEVDSLVKFKVEGTRTNKDGDEVPFSYHLLLERYEDEAGKAAYLARLNELQAAGDKHPITSALFERTKNWWGVQLNKVDVPFEEEIFRRFMNQPAMASHAHYAYLAACGVKAKN